MAAATAAAAATASDGRTADDKSLDYDYNDDDEFDMEAEMLRREFREASLLANGGGAGGQTTAVLEPSNQTQVDLPATADRIPVAVAGTAVSRQLQQSAAADHSSDGSSSVDSRRVVDMAYAYGNQSEYTAEHCAKTGGGGGSQTVKPMSTVNNNDDEYLVEQRLLGHGTEVVVVGGGNAGAGTEACTVAAVGSPPLPTPQPTSQSSDICSAEDRTVAT